MAQSKACGIYMITHNVGGEYYIGQSKNIFSRWSEHFRHAEANKSNSILYKAIKKYGITAFSFKILELCNENELDEKEKFYIALYESTKYFNYNIQEGGVGGSSPGSKNHNSKLTEDEVYDIRESYKNLETKQATFDRYKNKVSKNTFADVWTGKTWQHVHMDVYDEETKLKQRNNYDKVRSHKWMQKLSDEDILKIRLLRKKKFKPQHVYVQYYSHINRSTFNDIWYYHTFKHLIVEED